MSQAAHLNLLPLLPRNYSHRLLHFAKIRARDVSPDPEKKGISGKIYTRPVLSTPESKPDCEFHWTVQVVENSRDISFSRIFFESGEQVASFQVGLRVVRNRLTK